MKKIVFILCFFPFIALAQPNYKQAATLPIDCNYFTTDNLGNIYAVKETRLIKYDKTGKELFHYSNKNYGNITSVDASNMLKILLFYKDFQTIQFLDNTLAETSEPVNLSELGFQQVQLVCASHNNSMWVYDAQNFELIQLDINLTITHRSGNLNAVLLNPIQSNYLTESNNRLFLNNPETGLLVFDIYGTFNKLLHERKILSFQPIGDWVYILTGQNLKAINLITSEEKIFLQTQNPEIGFRLETNVLYLNEANAIHLYTPE